MMLERAVLVALVAFCAYTFHLDKAAYLGQQPQRPQEQGSDATQAAAAAVTAVSATAARLQTLSESVQALTATVEALQKRVATLAPPRTYLAEVDAERVERYPLAFASPVVGGMHRPYSLLAHPASEIEYALGGRFASLHFGVGLHDDKIGLNGGGIVFSVLVDGTSVWTHTIPPHATAQSQKLSAVALNVAGAQRVVLKVASDGSPNGAWALWLDPYVQA